MDAKGYRICWIFGTMKTRGGLRSESQLPEMRALVDHCNEDRSGSHWIEDESGARVYESPVSA